MIKSILSKLEVCYSCREFYYHRILELKKENKESSIETLNKMIEINQIHIEEHKEEILKVLGLEKDVMTQLIIYFK
jgi:hypothetical protein